MIFEFIQKEWEAHLRDQRLKPKDNEKSVNQESVSAIKDGVFSKSNIEINSGNDNHKRYYKISLKKDKDLLKNLSNKIIKI